MTASVEPTSILNESGQSVPPSFYEHDVNVQKSTSEHFHGYTSQRGLPEHLYGTWTKYMYVIKVILWHM